MPKDRTDLPDRLTEATSVAREVLRELHEAQQALRSTIKEAHAATEALRTQVRTQFHDEVQKLIEDLHTRTRADLTAQQRNVQAAFDRQMAPLNDSLDTLQNTQKRLEERCAALQSSLPDSTEEALLAQVEERIQAVLSAHGLA